MTITECTSWLAALMAVSIAKGAEVVDVESVTNTAGVVAVLDRYPFADASISSFDAVDFDERKKVVAAILEKEFMVTSTNALLAIADYLSGGVNIPVENYHADILAAHKQDRFAEFGDSNYVVRAGVGHFGPVARACRQQYRYRAAYNSKLRNFRRNVLRLTYRQLNSPRWSVMPMMARNALWIEFRRRMNLSPDEQVGLPESMNPCD